MNVARMILTTILAALLASEQPAPRGEAKDLYVILGRPTTSSITARVIAPDPLDAFLEYGTASRAYVHRTPAQPTSRERPATFALSGLVPETRYYYRVGYAIRGVQKVTDECSFLTARVSSAPYGFVVQADSHLLNKADKPLYASTMSAMAALGPDLFFDLGDTFLNDKDPATPAQLIDDITYEQVPYFSTLARTAPLFLVIGNHEGEYGYLRDGTANNMSVSAALSRKRYFPNPVPDGFYSGNTTTEPFIGQPENYYAFTWGDALFVALDPYRYTTRDPDAGGDSWDWTIGDAQYRWLTETLEQSKAKYKFVFAHHAIGNIRGGARVAGLYEWGGSEPKGKNLFAVKRPGWAKPIQQLMNDTHVTVFFQGHDHIFSREKVGSVTYQTLPKPAEVIPDAESNVSYYEGGDNQINSGFLRVLVSPEHVLVEYHRSVVPGQPQNRSIGVVYSYTVDAAGNVTVLKKSDDAAAFAAYGGGPKDTTGEKDDDKRDQKGRGKPERQDSEAGTPAPDGTGVSIGMSGGLHAQTLLGAPSDNGIVLSTAFDAATRYYYQYGTSAEDLAMRTPERNAVGGTATAETLTGLAPATTYHYRLMTAGQDSNAFTPSALNRFVTRKPPGTPFTCVVEADPHLDENSSQQVYERVLGLMAAEQPDFAIDLGDSSMAEKLAATRTEVEARNRLLRSYWDNIGASIPFFMALGNHDGEHGWKTAAGRPSRAEAAAIRRAWFPSPVPRAGSTYTGLSDTNYSFTWGDALFIVLDPFANTAYKSATDNWSWTLGKEQYDWLASVLARTDARYRFLFIHQLVGGMGKDTRGGADYAGLYEWGGRNPDGTSAFAKQRPGWAMPIHDLLVAGKVDVVFHGHDHFYAKEVKDGVVYQCVPQPSAARAADAAKSAEEYGYTQGTFLPSPGYLRLRISAREAVVDFIQGTGGVVAATYIITP